MKITLVAFVSVNAGINIPVMGFPPCPPETLS
jgi:hypothetical protein